MYAETGFAAGGEFKPHKTHRNGLSVDFMVPVTDPRGRSTYPPTSPLNKWGYNLEFDARGRHEDLSIDFEAIGAHLVALHRAARSNGAGIWRVIFDPKLQTFLLGTSHGSYISENIALSKKPSWVRHDEHYHVDFDIACKPLSS
jgi:penicillin-insensitive murein DD-endopeptidase